MDSMRVRTTVTVLTALATVILGLALFHGHPSSPPGLLLARTQQSSPGHCPARAAPGGPTQAGAEAVSLWWGAFAVAGPGVLQLPASGLSDGAAALTAGGELIRDSSFAMQPGNDEPFELADGWSDWPEVPLPGEYFFLYTNQWALNYQHFLAELAPKLEVYLSVLYPRVRLLIPPLLDTSLLREVLSTLGVDVGPAEHTCGATEEGACGPVPLAMCPEVRYKPDVLATASYSDIYDSDHSLKVRFLRRLRAALGLPTAGAPSEPRAGRQAELAGCSSEDGAAQPRVVFLSRRDSAEIGADRMGNAAGAARVVINRDALVDALETATGGSLAVVELGKVSLQDKAGAVGCADILVTPFGANLMNLFFVPQPRHVVVVVNTPYVPAIDWFRGVAAEVYADPQGTTMHAFEYPSEGDDKNAPYEVDVAQVVGHVEQLLAGGE
ncbi:unnamed protein product [Pedinophyceae sp. YPF-701]|nr:unnamed protein product [Pedinophyceae sp. YPF-701]